MIARPGQNHIPADVTPATRVFADAERAQPAANSVFFWDQLEQHGEAVALVYGADQDISYAQLAAMADLFATQLRPGRQLVALGVMPIAPHLSLDRAVVLAEGVQVVLRAQSEFQVVLSVDGMDPIPLSADDTVQVAANQHSLRMVRFGEPNYFYRDLADVLHRNPVLQENHHDG